MATTTTPSLHLLSTTTTTALASALEKAPDLAPLLDTYAAIADSIALFSLPPPERFGAMSDAVFGSRKLKEVTKTHLLPLTQREEYAPAPLSSTSVLVIGAGPGGLRTAIEAALLGADVAVVEKRTSFSRNNVLHLWRFCVHDLRGLGVRSLCPQFCRGGLNHVSIKGLQLALSKIACLLGVRFFSGVSVDGISPFDPTTGRWHLESPSDLPPDLEAFAFDAVVGAAGASSFRLRGFSASTFRANPALGVTANFVRLRGRGDVSLKEIPGVSRQYHRDAFDAIETSTGVALQNFVLYKDSTVYVVCTVAESSLASRGVFLDPDLPLDQLLAPGNRDQTAFLALVKDVVHEASLMFGGSALSDPEFALNARGDPDVALFDFTEIEFCDAAARCESAAPHDPSKSLVLAHVGDQLVAPFWPQGTGASRAILSALDTCHLLVQLASGVDPVSAIEERNRVYTLLSSTNDHNIRSTFSSHTFRPSTRYDFIPPAAT